MPLYRYACNCCLATTDVMKKIDNRNDPLKCTYCEDGWMTLSPCVSLFRVDGFNSSNNYSVVPDVSYDGNDKIW